MVKNRLKNFAENCGLSNRMRLRSILIYELLESVFPELKENKQIINEICKILKSCDWELNTIKTSINKYIDENDKKISDIAPILRLGLTGKTNTPDIFKIIFILGKNKCLNRLKIE